MKVILITGASSGIGYESAEHLAKQGHKVYGGARRLNKMQPLEAFGVSPIALDVTDDASIQNAVDHIIEKEGRIDVLINNAGYGSYGAIEAVSIEEAKRQFEVNIFGLARMSQLVIPHMRNQKAGRIVNISSMGGRMTTYFGGWYHASKYAVEALSDAMRMELKDFGIDVVIIEPGGIKTNWGIITADNLEQSSKGTPYEAQATQAAAGLRKQYENNLLSDPKVIANAISKAVNKATPKTRYLVGFGAKPLVFLHTFLPDKSFDYIMKKMMQFI